MTCEHCGATPTDTLFGYPVFVHADGCPNAPPPLVVGDIILIQTKRFLCLGCGLQYDRPGEAEHALGCVANPLTN